MVKKIIFFVVAIFLFGSAFAINKENRSTVNILTWWGYLNHPWVSEEVHKKCNADISYDEFYTSDEFLERFKAGRGEYDIIIFPIDAYNILQDEVKLDNSKLYKKSAQYNETIKQQYIKSHYPHNVAYFSHVITGVLFDPKHISISSADPLSMIFQKAKSDLVIIADDPVSLSRIVNNFESKDFKNLFQNSKPIFSNEINHIIRENEARFAFSYHWSNIGLWTMINFNTRYQFLVNPSYSYLGSDLIAQLHAGKTAACVADVLSSREFLRKMQDTTYNFSPYGDNEHITDPLLKKLQKITFDLLPKLKWNDTVSKDVCYKIHQDWKTIKFDLEHEDK